ncbi:putative serine protein kinase, PrkA [Thermaerobacter marianensis DSM 12885]|uniref:Serine protein kinase, PrkA n=1 Tax=Thermaerobacter marianensis (strain ATCC 700841 / DSM 12885 / JCM 10246 / 7p75a) TaxID=644966 RepID=E6SG83_THEM7|nr:protein PrkA [Thermaerobacter marianensis]ADU50500.1 putative serine protein kinase, PrkA [Thermaerobacter marianensis DSM 12885]
MGTNLHELLRRHREDEARLGWEGTFADYLEIVRQRPQVARLSHARLFDMLKAAGVTEAQEDGDGGPRPRQIHFFDGQLFGLEEPLNQLYDYLESAARRLEVRKRILLLMGPVGGGKSTIVALLKRGLERYTRTDEGAVYALKGCPMHEEPLHLIPEPLRPTVSRQLGVHIEGSLCPVCRYRLEHEFGGDVERFPVQRIVFSEAGRVGIGTFTPSDEKSQDIAELVGSIDLSTVGEYGTESHPLAYRFDGELNVANRGLMEFVELLKAQTEFLYALLTLSQEQSIKTGRFAMIYADEVVIGHTNEAEYQAFVKNQRNEALIDRMILIKVPYNLRLSEEVKIYRKLLAESDLQGVHIAPHTLEVAAMFAILTRLEPPKHPNLTLMKKLRLYDGQPVEGFSPRDVREMREGAEREGMTGVSPRYVINCLSSAVIRAENNCLGPLAALRALRDGLDHHTGLTKEQRERYLNLIHETRREYDEIAKNEVNRAFVYSFEETARNLFNNYLDHIEAYCHKTKLRDPITEEERDPDEKLMRSIEEQIGVPESAKKAFREEILLRLSALARRGQKFDYTSHDRLREALEKKLFSDLRNVVKITTSATHPDEEQLKRINQVVQRLCERQGYCPACANEVVRYVGQLLGR